MRTAGESQSERKSRPFLVLGAIAGVVLLGALGSWPYGYYRFLRWVVCAAAVIMAIGAYSGRMLWAVWLLGFVALLFNPLAPVHLTREIWRPIDGVTAIVLFLLGILIRGEPKDK
jgi:arginine exporter protein ArgO